VHVATEMQRRKLDLPLLIGGATTSRQHTAVKIAPQYAHTTVHVLDASRAVNVVSNLLDPQQRERFDQKNREDQAQLRRLHARGNVRPLEDFEAANRHRPVWPWRAEDIPVPAFLGRRTLEHYPLDEIARYIDWTFFFTAWELKGRYPDILDHPKYGQAARELFDNAKPILQRIVDEKLLTAQAVYGFWPANSQGNDIILWADDSRNRELMRFPMLRQQWRRDTADPQYCLADFVAPLDSGLPDHVGAFAVTAGIGTDALARSYEAQHDDYNAIIVKALADRLAEAFAELLHARVRREWGYGRGEALGLDDLIAERYRGIRPAFGYPACPDHTEKTKLFSLLEAPRVGIELTEHFAMLPAASVSGIYLAHPECRYFNIGKIGRDQAVDYARRKGMPLAEVERWLAPNLGYDPAGAAQADSDAA
jgi:5-methyltetrahydrofolate--homocysteine methyltransferase